MSERMGRRTSSRARRQNCKGEVAGVDDPPRATQKQSEAVRLVMGEEVWMLADTSWSWRGLGAAELEVEL